MEYDKNMTVGQNGQELAFFCPHCKTHITVIAEPQIVRCKDCKFKEKSFVADRQWWCNRLEKHCEDEWFCADGELKE